MKDCQKRQKKFRILGLFWSVIIVASVPLLVSPLNFMVGGISTLGFYFAACIAPFMLLLFYYWVVWKLKKLEEASPVNKDNIKSDMTE